MNTVSLVREAQRAVKKSAKVYTQVWVVFDKDDFGSFDEAIELAAEKVIRAAWSNQAFEYWLYLHFDYSDSALHRDEWYEKVSERLEKAGVKGGYGKSMPDLYELMMTKGDRAKAVRSAKKAHQRWKASGRKPSQCDPCTTVYELVEALLSCCGDRDAAGARDHDKD